MTYEEVMTVINKMIEEYGEEETIKSFIRMYLADKIDYNQLLEFIGLMGYEFNEEFKKRLKEKNVNV